MYSNWSTHSRQISQLVRRLSSTPHVSSRPLPPPRVHRSSTDILRALAVTVTHDPTAPHYKYHDDPYLIPQSNFRKRSHALAQEAGRKAAAWIRDTNPELFTKREWDPPLKMKTDYHNAEPMVPAFAPAPVYDENSQVTIADLHYTIEHGLVEDAITVFKLLGGVSSLDRGTAQSLLELTCYYHELEGDAGRWIEERWFANKDRRSSVWKNGGLAEEIFNSLEPKDAAAYNAIIQGMAKYRQMERAYQLSRTALEAGVPLSTETYNRMLSSVGYLREGVELRIQALLDMLREMQDQGLSCNEGTLTACMKSVAAWGGGRQLRTLALQLLTEFREYGVRPTLACYASLLTLLCKERGPKTDILTSILDDLESRAALEARDPADVTFFVTAMSVCNEHLQDVALADRVHTLLQKSDNYRLLGDSFKESIYCRHLVTLMCRHAPLERTLHFLDQMVPNVYVPEPSVMDEIIRALAAGGEGARLAETWSQLVVFGQARRMRLVEGLLAAMRSCYTEQDEVTKSKMRDAARQMLYFGDISEEDELKKDYRAPQASLSADALADIVWLCTLAKSSGEEWGAGCEAARRLRGAGAPRDLAPLQSMPARAVARGRLADASLAAEYLLEIGATAAARAGVEAALAAALNRSPAEARALAARPTSELASELRAELLPLVELHRASSLSAPEMSRHDTSSSDSEGEGDSSDSD